MYSLRLGSTTLAHGRAFAFASVVLAGQHPWKLDPNSTRFTAVTNAAGTETPIPSFGLTGFPAALCFSAAARRGGSRGLRLRPLWSGGWRSPARRDGAVEAGVALFRHSVCLGLWSWARCNYLQSNAALLKTVCQLTLEALSAVPKTFR